jgi:hypothetical protein
MGMTGSPEIIDKKEKKTHSAIKSVGVISLAALISTFAAITIIATTTTSQAYATTNDRAAQQDSIDVSGEIVDSTFCENGELIELSGNVHVVSRTVFDEETGSQHFVWHVNWQGVTGVGLTTGSEYRVIDTYNNPHNQEKVPCSAGSDTAVESFRLISQGNSAPDLQVHALFHITENAGDEATAEIQNIRVECR